MASTSSSSVQKSFKYDVFLSFQGEDTRNTFVDHLYHALRQRGIITYKEYETVEKRRKISDDLIRSIEDSRFHIIVFSKNYASSSWCLDELEQIIKCQNTVYPVFYDVDPSEVRNQSGAVGEAFAELVAKHENKEAVRRWREALRKASSQAVLHLKNTFKGNEAEFIQEVVEDISRKLYLAKLRVARDLVGMEIRVKQVVSSLEIDYDDVRMIGIKGMGGSGKTTLARAVFDQISISFEGKTFVENVREVSKGFRLKELQNKVLQDLLNDQSIDVLSVYDGKNKMQKMMPDRKVLVVLDDVDDIKQLEALAGEPHWFKPGSRIIITTRDEQVLLAHRVKFIHNVNLLSYEDAILLFCRNAFGEDFPIQGYEELSREVVRCAAGLPLTIKVLGSHLYGRSKLEWIVALERLKTIPLEEPLEKLELSYSGLENDQKEIFLDVACILKGETTGNAIRVLESCGLQAEKGLRLLEEKSLITISNDGRLLLHNNIEEMGWSIVRRVDPYEPSRHSRLWIKEQIEDILCNRSGTKATRSVKLLNTYLGPDIIMKGLTKMKELGFLYVDNGDTNDVYASISIYKYVSLPDALRYLYWRRYPLLCLPETFQANNLVNLEMPQSNISQLWEGGEVKVLSKLKYLNLSDSKLRAFDLGMTPSLEELRLEDCNDLVKLNMPVEHPTLKFLDLGYSKLRTINLGMTPNLEALHLTYCSELVELHMPVECPKLKFIRLSGSRVSKLNLGLTPLLRSLDLNDCYYLQEIQASVGCLKKLVYLNRDFSFEKHLESTGVESLAKLKVKAESLDTCPLHPHNNFPKFQFECFYDEPVPLSSGNIEKLISFGVCTCANLESFSKTICGLLRLGKFTLEGSIPEAPKDLYKLERLLELTLSMKKIKHIPDSICVLRHLKSLELKLCFLLEQLPKDLGRLECLEKLHLSDCTSLQDIPNNICKMKCLKRLHLPYCVLVKKLPEELGHLKSLEELNIEGTGIKQLPQSIIESKGLCIIWSRGRLETYNFTSFKKLSKYTASCYV